SGRAADLSREHVEAVNEFAPPSILVDHAQKIVHISDKAGRYLVHPAGPPTVDAADLVRPELAAELRTALHRVFDQGLATLTFPTTVEINNTPHHVSLQVSPVKQDGALSRALVRGPGQGDGTGAARGVVTQPRDDSLAPRQKKNWSQKKCQTATENLRAANEELQSINEEYRSTAEELETSKEELQSMNEELQ